jgi:hypothetical protein
MGFLGFLIFMALNDIIVPKENAQGDFTETVLTPAQIGAQVAGNYATLVGGTVPANQLPSYVDDVIEVANAAARPNPGETGKIYITTDNNKVFRWSGSAYVEIVASPGSTDAVPEGSTNLYHTTQRAAAAAPVQSVAGRTGAVTLAVADVSGAVASTDSRLSDSRNPTLHESTHHTGGTDAIAPNNIGAAWAQVLSQQTITGNTLLAAGRNRRITLFAIGVTANVDLPHENNQNGDTVTLVADFSVASTLTIRTASVMGGGSPVAYSTLATLNASGQTRTFVSNGTATGWTLRAVDAHKASHSTGGTDALVPSDIGAQSVFVTTTTLVSGNVTVPTTNRALIYQVTTSSSVTADIGLPSSGHQAGDIVVVQSTTPFASGTTLTIKSGTGSTLDAITASNQAYRYTANSTSPNGWVKVLVDTHTHTGSEVNVGTTANLPLKTGTNGVIEAGSFGTAAGTFCEGNDARLSDARTPSSTLAHKASHAINGTDFLAPSDIGAQSIFVTEDLGTITANVTLTAARAKIYTVTVNTFDTPTPNIQLPTTNVQAGDVVQIRFTTFTGREMPVRNGNGSFLGNSLTNGQRVTYIAASTSNNSWAEDGTNRHTHVVAEVTGAAASGSITTSGLTQSTARILGRTTASTGSIEEIQIGAGLSLSAGELSATGGAGVTAVGASTADVLSVSGSDLVADDPNADRIVFWDDSEGKLRYLEAGSGLSISGTTMTATASGGSKTYAAFTAEHNQPPATAFATLDTRNSIAVLDFDAATDESAVFVGVIPEGASLGSGLKVFLHWMASTATSGNCRWGVQFEKSGTDLDSDSFDTATEAHSAANGTSGIETVTEITATAIDSLAAGDRFRLKVFRNADDATNDTMTGDAELIAVEVRSAA